VTGAFSGSEGRSAVLFSVPSACFSATEAICTVLMTINEG
jgi:hypothetical protein